MRNYLTALFTCCFLTLQAKALEDRLPNDMRDKIDSTAFHIELNNCPAQEVADTLNKLAVVGVVIDAAISKQNVPAFKMSLESVLAGCEKLAKSLNAKVYVQGAKLYISNTPPKGTNSGEGSKGGDAGGVAPGKKPDDPAPPPKVPAPPVVKGPFTPGTDSSYPWSEKSPSACQKDLKPMLLYVYDPALKTKNALAVLIESEVLQDPNVRGKLKDFNLIRITTADPSWPKTILSMAKKSAALYVMDFKGSIYSSWHSQSAPPTALAVGAAADRALLGNANKVSLQSKYSKSKQEDPKADGNDRIAQGADRKDAGEKNNLVVPGINDDKKDKKEDAKRDKKKKDMSGVEDEE